MDDLIKWEIRKYAYEKALLLSHVDKEKGTVKSLTVIEALKYADMLSIWFLTGELPPDSVKDTKEERSEDKE